jgi:hypothetical protein
VRHGASGLAMYARLFPGSNCRLVTPMNLDEYFRQLKTPLDMRSIEDQNTLLYWASMEGKECTYGGFLEDRTQLWSGLYPPLKKKSQLVHLGADINNLAPGQPVASLTDGIVFHTLLDNSFRIGWGGRVIIQSLVPESKQPIYIMYAHLSDKLPQVGAPIAKGQIIGFIGDPQQNGGWFPHLHLQVMTHKYIHKYAKDLNSIDGYAIAPASLKPDKVRKNLEKSGLLDPIQFAIDHSL